jgi:hypothetical protein
MGGANEQPVHQSPQAPALPQHQPPSSPSQTPQTPAAIQKQLKIQQLRPSKIIISELSPTNTSTRLVNNTNIKINGRLVSTHQDDQTNIEHVSRDNVGAGKQISTPAPGNETVNKVSERALENKSGRNTIGSAFSNGSSYSYKNSNVYFHKSFESVPLQSSLAAPRTQETYCEPYYRSTELERRVISSLTSSHHYRLVDGVLRRSRSSSAELDEVARI